MAAPKLKNFLIIVFTLALVSSGYGENRMKTYAYGTKEFTDYIQDASITLDEAWKIQLDYKKQSIKDKLSFQVYKTNVVVDFIVDGHYVFTLGHLNNKQLEGYYLSGIWVNCKTGKVFEKSIDQKVRSNVSWRKP